MNLKSYIFTGIICNSLFVGMRYYFATRFIKKFLFFKFRYIKIITDFKRDITSKEIKTLFFINLSSDSSLSLEVVRKTVEIKDLWKRKLQIIETHNQETTGFKNAAKIYLTKNCDVLQAGLVESRARLYLQRKPKKKKKKKHGENEEVLKIWRQLNWHLYANISKFFSSRESPMNSSELLHLILRTYNNIKKRLICLQLHVKRHLARRFSCDSAKYIMNKCENH